MTYQCKNNKNQDSTIKTTNPLNCRVQPKKNEFKFKNTNGTLYCE